MSRANVPKFGNWENEDNVPYTVYFDKARKTKGEKMINPNDPQENPEMFAPSPPAPNRVPPSRFGNRPEEQIGRGAVRPIPEHRRSSEEGDYNEQFANSPTRTENMGQRSGNEARQRPAAARSNRPSAGSDSSEHSFDRSPLHPHHQAKVGGRDTGSPAWEGKNHVSSHGTPGRSRLKPTTRGDESPEKGAAVPKFGAWDENNPESAENLTHIFNKVREERNTGVAGNMPGTPKHQSYGPRSQQTNQPKKSCFCFW